MSDNTYGINVLSIKDTLDYIMKNNSSIARFCDGELDLIFGNSIPYQKYGKLNIMQKVLLMLWPAALAKDLANNGIQAIDIGHIDSEYEWFKMGATEVCVNI